MSNTIAVKYTGNNEPHFVDHIYGSGLTFEKGQTRLVPPLLAASFLQHSDVFEAGDEKSVPKAKAKSAEDDTQEFLDKREAEEKALREMDDNRYSLFNQLESMDKAGLLEWSLVNYKQKLPGNYGVPKLLDMAKGFVDQYGMPT